MKFKGKVFKGRKEGTKIGFPTANIKVSESVSPGIYVGFASLNEDTLKLKALFYVPENDKKVIECHILDFPKKDLYEFEISVELINKIRNDYKFFSLEKACEQIKKDEAEARQWFKNKQD